VPIGYEAAARGASYCEVKRSEENGREHKTLANYRNLDFSEAAFQNLEIVVAIHLPNCKKAATFFEGRRQKNS